VIETPELPKIDVERTKIIDSFLEPLNTFLDVVDFEEASTRFQNLIESLTLVMQEHFNLSSPSVTVKKGSIVKSFDPYNAQKVQRLYRWKRRRCIRNLINSQLKRCPASKASFFSHFKNYWSPPCQDFTLIGTTPPDLPPILHVLSPEAVSSCPQGCENSAPGPDLLTYRHWRE
ncbi:uncharacterized protein NPIL_38161, partial [Nephila pilipes]